jgi:hypothetical protein
MDRAVDFNFIINAGLNHGLSVESSLQLAYLIGITKGVQIKLDAETIFKLTEQGYINSSTVALPKGLSVFRKLKTDNTGLARELRELYPPGMKDDRWPWRGTVPSVSDKLDGFNEMYPDITNQEIIDATKAYLEVFSEEAGRSLLPYFIWKTNDGTKRSLLAEWAYAKRESGEIVKIKSNIDQL